MNPKVSFQEYLSKGLSRDKWEELTENLSEMQFSDSFSLSQAGRQMPFPHPCKTEGNLRRFINKQRFI